MVENGFYEETPGKQDVNTEIVIKVDNVSKAYTIWSSPSARLHGPILGQIGQMPFLPAAVRNWCGRHSRQSFKDFYALKGVSLEIRKGESFGIIGRNGSGKSTLLQIIAGILTPTDGSAAVDGKVAALLELGSGFNPEFTGRENVYMNASVLGLSRAQIDAKFEEIAAFADIDEFIDQPVKTYSSGMLVRLAFAVTTSVDADVLLIDEALAVGDIFFRQKCYRHLENLRSKGVSIVLVSHGMGEVEQFCQRAALLDHGKICFQGASTEAVKRYYLLEQGERLVGADAAAATGLDQSLNVSATPDAGFFWPAQEALCDVSDSTQVSNGSARCRALAVCDAEGQSCQVFEQGQTASFFYEFELLKDAEVPVAGLEILNERGMIVHGKNSIEHGSEVPCKMPGGTQLRVRQDISLEVAVGEYTFTVGLATMAFQHYQHRAAYAHPDLEGTLIRLCHVPNVGRFAVVFRRHGEPVQLLHHGIANLPGGCRVAVVAPDRRPVEADAFL